jgi:hypothetical protein
MKLSRKSVVAALVVAAVFSLVVLTAQTLLTDFKLDRASLRQEECMCRLVQIRLALNLYVRDNGGRLPLSLDALVDGKYVDRRNLSCPATGMEYLYLLAGRDGRLDALETNQFLLADVSFPHGGGKEILIVGGQVLYLSKKDLGAGSEDDPASLQQALRAAASRAQGSPDGRGSE